MSKLFLILFSFILSFMSCSAKDGGSSADSTKRLKITVGEHILIACVYDNPTSRDFIAQLPITVDMDDYAGAEKIFYPPQKLSTSERHAVDDPAIGDITVYAPWGNIAIFYRNYSGSRDLIRIGRIEGDIEILRIPGKLKQVTFELIEFKSQ